MKTRERNAPSIWGSLIAFESRGQLRFFVKIFYYVYAPLSEGAWLPRSRHHTASGAEAMRAASAAVDFATNPSFLLSFGTNVAFIRLRHGSLRGLAWRGGFLSRSAKPHYTC